MKSKRIIKRIHTNEDHINDAISVSNLIKIKDSLEIWTPHVVRKYAWMIKEILNTDWYLLLEEPKRNMLIEILERYRKHRTYKKILIQESRLNRNLSKRSFHRINAFSKSLIENWKQCVFDYLALSPWNSSWHALENYCSQWIISKPKVFQGPWNIYQPLIAQEIIGMYEHVNASWNTLERYANIVIVSQIHPSIRSWRIPWMNKEWKDHVEKVLNHWDDDRGDPDETPNLPPLPIVKQLTPA